jgi:hypothetical protein
MAKKQIKKYVFEPGISKDASVYPKAVALLLANKAFLQAQVVAFINYNITNNIAPYVSYTYASAKCTRDVGYFIDAVAHDLRYGGNVKSRQVSQYFWIEGEPMIRGDVSPETSGQAYLASIINNFIFTNTTVSPSYGNGLVQTKFVGQNGETGASSRNTSLWNIFSTVITNGVSAIPVKVTGVSTVRLLGNYTSSELLLITDTFNNEIIYNFADPAFPITIEQKQGRSSGNGLLLDDLDFPTWWQITDAISTIYLTKDTSSMNATDDLQIFVEEPYQTIRPWEFGTDAIERMRVAAPQAMLDADFEYGLQPTKWQALGLIRGYPSIYEIPGTDLSVASIVSDASVNTGNFGSSLITVFTNGTHGFTAQQPLTVKGLDSSISGFARAEGSFLVYSVPSSISFTYYASAKVGTTENQSLYTSFVQIRQAGFYTGASIGQPAFSVFSNGSTNSITSKFNTALGSFNIAFNGTSPTPGSPISGSPNIAQATAVSGVVGAGTVVANVRDSTLSTDTFVSLVDLTGVQQSMAIDNGSGTAVLINSIAANTLNLSGAIGQTLKGANGTNVAVSGTNINSVGTNSHFNVSRTGGSYTVTDARDSSANGEGYVVGDILQILGTALGGTSPTNDILITVSAVDSSGAITNFSYSGTSITGSGTYSNVNQTSSSGGGGGAQITVVRTGGTGSYAITLAAGGASYTAGDTITWAGTSFGGTSPANNIVITVDGTDLGGGVVDYTLSGTPIGATGNATYTGLTGANVPVTGTSAVFNIVRNSGSYSIVSPLLTATGTGYAVGNRIRILGTSLDGIAPLNNCVVQVTGVNPLDGSISTASVSGIPYAGAVLTIYPTLSISEATTGIIPDGTVLNVGAIATVQVDFPTAHGLMPGTTILTSISSQPAPAFSSTLRTLPASGSWTGVAFSNGVFVAVLSSSQSSARSLDGQTWAGGGNLPSSASWTSVAAGAIGATNYVVAVAGGASSTVGAYSTNGGTSWSAITMPAGNWSSVCYYGGFFVAVATGGTVAAYSLDGQTFTVSGVLPSSTTWTDVAGGLIGTSVFFVAIASGGTASAYSVDNGVSWLSTGALPGSTNAWSSVAFGNSKFFAVASGTTQAAVSTNGSQWTAVTLPSSASWNSVVYGDDNFVVVASGSTSALTSFTAETGSFAAQTMAQSSTWEEIVFGSYTGLGRFVIVGSGNNALDIALTSANHQIATGPHVITQVPSLTSIRYPSRTTGTINTSSQGLTGVLYARPDSFFTHRPFDGGVQLGTGGPSHGAQAIRQSKKYIRYQSGKGMMYTTGGLFAPSYNISSATALDYVVGSFITFTCDDTDHGLQPGATIEIIGMVSFEYNGEYIVESIVDARRFRVRSLAYLSTLSGALGTDCKVLLKRWHGATVRIGAFDEQNGIFYQYDGQEMAVVRRSSTNQLSGTVSIVVDNNLITGSGTRFQDQLKVGDKIVIRGMSHIVTSIASQTSMTMSPDWRGANSIVGARVCITEELYIPQRDWNMDPIDGTGPSGYNMLPWRMQMLGMQYSWYAAGFIEFMLRGADGKFVFLHRIRNSNVNTEAYMRTANLPVRYDVENRSAVNKLATAINSSAASIVLTEADRFPSSGGIIYVDNELMSYTGKSGRTLTGVSRSVSFTSFTSGQNRTFTAGPSAAHEVNAGVLLVSCTTSPTISHWGSALLTDGLFDTDRGYIFNYAATGLSITTTKQTAFMIRLAPSVSNAIVGDLGERDLLNRAQLLLNEVAITADTGTGTIVVEGVLNPKNYPTDPTKISWNGLSSSAAGGQPSFAQIALGGSINWGGVANTTTTASVQGALTTTITARGFSTVTQTITAIAAPTGIAIGNLALANSRNDFYILNSAYDAIVATPLRIGDTLSLTTYLTGGQTISNITRAYNGTTYTRIVMSSNATASSPTNINQTITVTSSISTSYANAYQVGRTDFLITNADNTASSIAAGDTLLASTFVISNQTISTITPSYATVAGVAYTRIVMSAGANATQAVNTNTSTTVTAAGTAATYSGTNFLFFTSATWNASGASVGTRVATSVTQFAAGTSVAAISTRRLGGISIIRTSFTQTSNTSIAAAATITFQFGDPQYALPGEQVFSFLCQPGGLNALDLRELKELTTTAIGGRGAFPNGPDVLAINVFKASGSAVSSGLILRWGEAQA